MQVALTYHTFWFCIRYVVCQSVATSKHNRTPLTAAWILTCWWSAKIPFWLCEHRWILTCNPKPLPWGCNKINQNCRKYKFELRDTIEDTAEWWWLRLTWPIKASRMLKACCRKPLVSCITWAGKSRGESSLLYSCGIMIYLTISATEDPICTIKCISMYCTPYACRCKLEIRWWLPYCSRDLLDLSR